jgi:predicted O-methyltransferase YrrM
MELLPEDFIGTVYRLANNWSGVIPDSLSQIPINYLEIGAFVGANFCSVASSYARHPDSKLYCIDPWEDYSDYSEYKGEQLTNFGKFKHNTKRIPYQKVTVLRGLSCEKIPILTDSFFDLIYIDGNHEPEYVLEDAVLAFRKLKIGGYMIFDDYGWGGPDLTQKGIEGFCMGYRKRIEVLGERNSQVFLRKIR